MPKITHADVFFVRLKPKVVRTDAIQSFVSQETPILKLTADDGSEGIGYSYTIGSGGSAILALLRDHLLPRLLGQDPDGIEAIWRDLSFSTHATQVGAITSLALAAIDTALWDRRARLGGLPLWRLAGGAKPQIPLYTTEGGWLHLSVKQLVTDALAAKQAGFRGAKLKIGKPSAAEDFARIKAVREAVGNEFSLMVDANQSFTLDLALARAHRLAELDLRWFEEPLPADNLQGHRYLAQHSPIPIAVGESLYSIGQFGDYVQAHACQVVQVDVARVGGITPWLKIAHMAECHNLPVCPHFLMELHVSLSSAIVNAPWLEYIPQLDTITRSQLDIHDGCAHAPNTPGLGIDWDWPVIKKIAEQHFSLST